MAATSLMVDIGANVARMQRDMSRVNGIVGGAMRSIKTAVGGVAVAMSAAFSVRALGGAIKGAAAFEKQLDEVASLLDSSLLPLMKGYRREILGMSAAYGESTTTLTKALYDIISASVDAADATTVLEEAIRAAKGGVSDTATAADALTTVLNAYGMEAKDVSDISDAMFTTIKYGKTTFNELAPAMGRLAPIANAAGVSLEEVAAAMATLTRTGVTTDEAVTGLRTLLLAYLKSSGGLDALTLANKGLIGAMEELQGISADRMATTITESRAMISATVLVDNLTGFQRDYAAALNDTGLSYKAFVTNTDNAQDALEMLKATLKVAGIEIGDLFLKTIQNASIHINNAAKFIIGFGEAAADAGDEFGLAGVAVRAELGMWIQGVEDLWSMLSAFPMAIIDHLDRVKVKLREVHAEVGPLQEAIDGIQPTSALGAEWDKWGRDIQAAIEFIEAVVGRFFATMVQNAANMAAAVGDIWSNMGDLMIYGITRSRGKAKTAMNNIYTVVSEFYTENAAGFASMLEGMEKDYSDFWLKIHDPKTLAKAQSPPELPTETEGSRARAKAAADAAKAAADAAAKAAAAAAKAKLAEDALAEATAKTTKMIDAQIDALELQAATFGMSADEATLYKMALDGATDEQLALAEAALDTIAALETVERQQKQTTEAMAAATEKSFSKDMAEAMSGWASNFSGTLNEMVWNADTAFEDIAKSFAKMLSQMVLQKLFVEPLLGGLMDAWDIWNLPYDQKPGFIGPPSPFKTQHTGGVIGEGGGMSRTVSPGVFIGAPRLHSGLFANEFPAILEKGETVIPKGGGAGGCNVKVIVNNMGQDATAQQQDAPRWNGQEWVVTVWMDAYNRNVGGLRRAFGG